MARLFLILLCALLLTPDLAFSQAARPGPTVRTVTGASDTILNADCGNIVQFNRGTSVAVTLPQAASGGNFNARCQIQFVNIGAGNATITPTTSQIDGRASVVLQQGGGLVVTSSGGQWVSGGIYPALSTTGIVDSDQLPTATDTVKGGIIAGTCITMGGAGNRTASVTENCRLRFITIEIDGGGSALTANSCVWDGTASGAKVCRIDVPITCVIQSAIIKARPSGSISFDVAAVSYANDDAGATHPASGDKISASAPVAVSSATKAVDSTLTGWSKTISGTAAAPVVVALQVNGTPSTVEWAQVTLPCLPQ